LCFDLSLKKEKAPPLFVSMELFSPLPLTLLFIGGRFFIAPDSLVEKMIKLVTVLQTLHRIFDMLVLLPSRQ